MNIRIVDPDLRRNFSNYVLQSIAAGIAVTILIAIYQSITEYGIVIASIGASAFTIFCIPNHITAQPRNVIGGHFLGIMSGMGGYLILNYTCTITLYLSISYGISVILTAFLMVSFDAEHPPAAGTAIAITQLGIEEGTMFIMIAVIFMSLLKRFLRKRLVDLV